MTQWQHRLFIFLDEWLGIILWIYLYEKGDKAFVIVFPAWIIMVYGIAYRSYWRRYP